MHKGYFVVVSGGNDGGGGGVCVFPILIAGLGLIIPCFSLFSQETALAVCNNLSSFHLWSDYFGCLLCPSHLVLKPRKGSTEQRNGQQTEPHHK